MVMNKSYKNCYNVKNLELQKKLIVKILVPTNEKKNEELRYMLKNKRVAGT